MATDEKVALVLGASGGLGMGMARRFAIEGFSVVLSDIEIDELASAEELLRAEGHSVIALRTNVARQDEVHALRDFTLRELGRVDVVCNTVGVYTEARTWEMSDADWRWQMDVNFWGVLYTIRSFIPAMIEQRSGHLITTASTITLTSRAHFPAYDASKHAVMSVSESLQHDLVASGSGVRVSVMLPGAIRSKMYDSGRNRPPEYGESRLPAQERDIMQTYMENKGADPDQLAGILFAQLERGHFYVFGREEDREYADAWLSDIRSGRLSSSPFQQRPGPGSHASQPEDGRSDVWRDER